MINPKLSLTVILLTICGTITPALAQFNFNRPDFFRDGYNQMQQEIQLLQQQQQTTPQQQVEHPSQLLTVTDGDLRWQKFIFRDAGFSVWMPEAIQSNETVILNTSLGKIPFEVFATHPQALRYVAAYSDVLDDTLLSNPQKLLDTVRDGIIARTQYKLISDQSISLGNYQGKQLSMESQGEMITFRVYLVGKRIYVLAASQKETQDMAQNVQSFFDSFRLLQ